MSRRTSYGPALGLLLLVAAACADDPLAPDPAPAAWRDLGTLPAVDRVSAVAVLGNTVYVGTSDGVVSRPLDGAGAWRRAGLAGLDVHVLRAWDAPAPTLYAAGYPSRDDVPPVHRTTDGGATWIAGGAGLRSRATGDWLGVADLAIQGGSAIVPTPVLYATASGTNIARSLDQGATWTFVHGPPEEMATYDCLLHVLGTSLYQGCEAPLDIAWVRRYDIAERTRPSLGDGALVVDDIENRRINAFASRPDVPALARTLYVGVEGGLVSLEESGAWRWVYKVVDGVETPYTYVRAVWVDPADPRHIVFGGGEPEYAFDRSGLRETFDGGRTATIVRGPEGIDFARAAVPAAVPVGPGGRDLLLVVDDGRAHRVYVRTTRAAAR